MRVLKAADTGVTDLAFSPDGRALAAADRHLVYLWNLEENPAIRVRLEMNEFEPRGGLGFSADGRSLNWLVKSSYDSSRVPSLRRIYDRDSRNTFTEKTFAAANKLIHDAAHTSDGTRGLSLHQWSEDRLIGWRLAEGGWVQTWSLSTAGRSVERLTLAPDGALFAMFTRPSLGEKWDKKPRKVEVRESSNAELAAVGDYPYSVEAKRLLFSPDARQLVGINAMNLLVWPLAGRELGPPLRVRNTTRKNFTAMAFHPSGRHLYVTSNGDEGKDATVHVFDTADWTRVGQFSWGLGSLKAVALSPDGTLAAAGGDRGDVVIWDVDA